MNKCMFYFSPYKIEAKLPFIMVFSRYIRIYMDVAFFVYECICDEALSLCDISWGMTPCCCTAAATGPTRAKAKRNQTPVN